MTHADRVKEAERAVIEAALAQEYKARSVIGVLREPLGKNTDYVVFTAQTNEAVGALLALSAATCPECGGEGVQRGAYQDGLTMRWIPDSVPCPAKCDNGRRRDK